MNLPAPAVDALAEHLIRYRRDALPTAPLFTRASGERLRGWDVQRFWTRARAAVGLPGVHLHDLRHGGLTLAAQSGATLKEVMCRGGHRTSHAALIYQHAAADRDAEVAARMGNLASVIDTVRARSGHAEIVSLPTGAAERP